MKIFLKTPLYKNSKYISHLLEHTTGNGENLENFFENFKSQDLRKMIGKQKDYLK